MSHGTFTIQPDRVRAWAITLPHAAEAEVDPISCILFLWPGEFGIFQKLSQVEQGPGSVILHRQPLNADMVSTDDTAAPRFVRVLNQTRDAHLAFPTSQQPCAQFVG